MGQLPQSLQGPSCLPRGDPLLNKGVAPAVITPIHDLHRHEWFAEYIYLFIYLFIYVAEVALPEIFFIYLNKVGDCPLWAELWSRHSLYVPWKVNTI